MDPSSSPELEIKDEPDIKRLETYIQNKSGLEHAPDVHLYTQLASQPTDPFTYIPEDVLKSEILRHVVDFVAFRGVCRGWRKLMTEYLTYDEEGWYPHAELMLYRKYDESKGRLSMLYTVTAKDRKWREKLQYMLDNVPPWDELAVDQRRIFNAFDLVILRNTRTIRHENLVQQKLDEIRNNLARGNIVYCAVK